MEKIKNYIPIVFLFFTFQLYGQNNRSDSIQETTKLEKTFEELDQEWVEGRMTFQVFGIVEPSPESIRAIKLKYNISYRSLGCVIDPYTSDIATTRNQEIISFLDKKFGTKWREDLIVKPHGYYPEKK